MNSSTLICLLLLMSTPGCAINGPAAAEPGAAAPSQPPSSRNGDLTVYSATYSQTLEQSEYSAHSDYTISTADDHFIEHVTNATGSFNSRPARVSLPAGDYHVRAQYNGGRFVAFIVVIKPDKTTVVDLDGEALSQGRAAVKEMIRLPDGQVVGWSAISSRSFTDRSSTQPNGRSSTLFAYGTAKGQMSLGMHCADGCVSEILFDSRI